MQDNVERTTQTLRVFLSEEIKLNRLLSKLNLDQTDRSLPHFAKALRRASANNYHDDVQFILNIHPEVLNYPDPNIKTQNTALHLATERGHCKVVEALLQANADQKILNASGKTAIMMASELKDNAVIQSILALYELNKKQDQGPPISPVCQNTSSWPMRFFSSTTNAVVSIIQSLRNK